MDGCKWYAQSYDELGRVRYIRNARTKSQAIADVKATAMPGSIRGLLDSKCNRGLGYIERFFGATANPDILLKVRDYLAARLKTA